MECDEKSREKPYAPAKICFFTSMKLLRLPVLLLLYLDIEIGCRPRGYNQITHSCFIRLTSSTTSPVQNRLPERNGNLFMLNAVGKVRKVFQTRLLLLRVWNTFLTLPIKFSMNTLLFCRFRSFSNAKSVLYFFFTFLLIFALGKVFDSTIEGL